MDIGTTTVTTTIFTTAPTCVHVVGYLDLDERIIELNIRDVSMGTLSPKGRVDSVAKC